MNLVIENISTIQLAKIKLKGLTVIAGENDTGKSTIGKVLFSIIKSIDNQFKKNIADQEIKKERMISQANNIEMILSRFIRHNINDKDGMRISEAFKNLSKEVDLALEFKIAFLDFDVVKLVIDNMKKRQNIIKENNFLDLEQKNFLMKSLEKLWQSIENFEEEASSEIYIKKSFSQFIRNEFRNDISNKYNNYKGKIELNSEKNNSLKIIINSDNKIDKLNYKGEFKITDATFIESPLFMQLGKMNEFAERDIDINFSNHNKDFLRKITNSSKAEKSIGLSLKENMKDRIEKVIKGTFSMENDGLKFNKENFSFDVFNLATGVKSFGIIQLLYNYNFINENSFLIVDEPEIHLHPKWQIEYARLIVELSKIGVNVLITSHSPYMIQALDTFAKKENLGDKSNFYLADRIGSNTHIIDASENMDLIFEKLVRPFDELMRDI